MGKGKRVKKNRNGVKEARNYAMKENRNDVITNEDRMSVGEDRVNMWNLGDDGMAGEDRMNSGEDRVNIWNLGDDGMAGEDRMNSGEDRVNVWNVGDDGMANDGVKVVMEREIKEISLADFIANKAYLRERDISRIIYENCLYRKVRLAGELMDILEKCHDKLSLRVPLDISDMLSPVNDISMRDYLFEFDFELEERKIYIDVFHTLKRIESILTEEFRVRADTGSYKVMPNNWAVSLKVSGVILNRVTIRIKVVDIEQ